MSSQSNNSGSNGRRATVIGGGLAGCEAAWQLAERGVKVNLVEMKPVSRSDAHASDSMAELVCSNSLRSMLLNSAVGLLKEELGVLGSLLIRVAQSTAVPAGRALAVDRGIFSGTVETAVASHPLISIERRRAEELPSHRAIIATGPLTCGGIAEALSDRGALLHYHDAIAPLVSGDGLDHTRMFCASRYEQEKEGDYLNCPFGKQEYFEFVKELVDADKILLRDFESAPFFEGCLPVEELAARGPLTLAHGPLKPVGLVDPATGRRPFAVVQLRPENRRKTAYNLVGFQTRLTRKEQKRVFRLIPGLERADFERYGQVHRNSFVDAPQVLDAQLRLNNHPHITLAGQLTGVEGYVESIACGLVAAFFVAAELFGMEMTRLPSTTAVGGLMGYLQRPQKSFQPSNVVWSMIDIPECGKKKDKREHKKEAAKRALMDLRNWISSNSWMFGSQTGAREE